MFCTPTDQSQQPSLLFVNFVKHSGQSKQQFISCKHFAHVFLLHREQIPRAIFGLTECPHSKVTNSISSFIQSSRSTYERHFSQTGKPFLSRIPQAQPLPRYSLQRVQKPLIGKHSSDILRGMCRERLWQTSLTCEEWKPDLRACTRMKAPLSCWQCRDTFC